MFENRFNMRITLFLYLVLLTALSFGQIINFPDANFKNALLNHNPVIDSNQDGEIQVSEANLFNGFLQLPANNIADFSGLEEFSAIDSLFIENNTIGDFDFPTLTELEYLVLISDEITSINLSSYSFLSELKIENDTLSGLSFADTTLLLPQQNLGTIDVSSNTVLERLTVFNYVINPIDLSALTLINQLTLVHTGLSTIDLSNNISLGSINVEQNSLTDLNVAGNSNLSSINFSNNSISSFDFFSCTNVYTLIMRGNPISSIDLSAQPNLIVLFADNTELSSLNTNSNPILSLMSVSGTNLNAINIASNTGLSYLNISETGITELDLSNQNSLTQLFMNSCNIDTIDLSNLSNLEVLYCENAGVHSLDLNNSPLLTNLVISSCPLLQELKVQNGNNAPNLLPNSTFSNNPNLYCIEVDNPIWADQNIGINLNVLGKDPWANFSSNCTLNITNPNVEGTLYGNDVCAVSGTEEAIPGMIMRSNPGNHWAITGANGLFQMYTDTGSYSIYPESIHPLLTPLCPSPFNQQINYPTFGQNITGVDFWYEKIDCPLLKVDMGIQRRRRCFRSNNSIKFQNYGFDPVSNVQVHLELPEYLSLVDVNTAYTIGVNGEYIFDLGTLNAMDSGMIYFSDSVHCQFDITGLNQITKVWITPANDCYFQSEPTYSQWDQSSIEVRGECDQGNTINFIIKNKGIGNMSAPSEYRIYDNYLLETSSTFQLNSGDSLIVPVTANGHTFRLEADQLDFHPGESFPSVTVEACFSDPQAISTGYVNGMPMDDLDYHVDIESSQIVDSYDPNDKTAFPSSILHEQYLVGQDQVEYRIRFQNSGSDTAFTVIIHDPISEDIDMGTLDFGASSHPYTVEFQNSARMIKFIFDEIDLPHEAVDEPGSHGFVMFKANLIPGLSLGDVVENQVGIYFDYNLPIMTNVATVTLFESQSNVSVESNIIEDESISVYPNPFNGEFKLVLGNSQKVEQFKILDVNGRELYFQDAVMPEQVIQFGEKGIYFIEVLYANGFKKIEKIVSN